MLSLWNSIVFILLFYYVKFLWNGSRLKADLKPHYLFDVLLLEGFRVISGEYYTFSFSLSLLPLSLLKVGKTKKVKEDKPKEEEGLGMNIKSVIVIALLMMLMLFAVHCTWVTSSAYSSPSIVLASYGQGG